MEECWATKKVWEAGADLTKCSWLCVSWAGAATTQAASPEFTGFWLAGGLAFILRFRNLDLQWTYILFLSHGSSCGHLCLWPEDRVFQAHMCHRSLLCIANRCSLPRVLWTVTYSPPLHSSFCSASPSPLGFPFRRGGWIHKALF